MHQIFHYQQPFYTELGGVLPELQIAYHTYGTLNEDKSNVVWICHALTANSDVMDWWQGVVGDAAVINPQQHYIVCCNILGSCYGTTGPSSIDPLSGKPYYSAFPAITIRDMVSAHILLRRHLGLDKIFLLCGGSMGGYQALEWAHMEKEVIQNLFLLATSAAESAWGIAIHTAQRLAIEADQSFGEQGPDAGSKGLKAARAIGLLTYRNYELMVLQQTETDQNKVDQFKATSYINYQGDKLVNRFNAYSYHLLGKAMDSHNLCRGRSQSLTAILSEIVQPTLLIGISSDILCPPQEQRFLSSYLENCHYVEINSKYGHDGFLTEHEKISKALNAWLPARAIQS